MTYVVALRLPGMNAIISDMRVTHDDGHSTNDALKSGILFDGCIYATIGDVCGTTDLMTKLRQLVSASSENPQPTWNRLVQFILNDYDFSKTKRPFQLLLSTRAFTAPRFYLVDSQAEYKIQRLTSNHCLASAISNTSILDTELTGRDQPSAGPAQHNVPYSLRMPLAELLLASEDRQPTGLCLMSFGSQANSAFSTSTLDSHLAGVGEPPLYSVSSSFKERAEALQKKLLAERRLTPEEVSYLIPYFFCFWLTELSLNEECDILEWGGVGGPFHFIYQTSKLEARQCPAIYFFAKPDAVNPSIYKAWHRVACVESGLRWEGSKFGAKDDWEQNCEAFRETVPIAADEEAVCDGGEANRPEDTRVSEVERAINLLPFVYFCGFGSYYSYDRNTLSFLLPSNNDRDAIFDEEGHFKPEIDQNILDSLQA